MAFNLFMHERNIYKERPDFKKIAIEYPEFRVYAIPDEKGRIHMDFNNQDALRVLTKILLKKDFNLDVTIPIGFLIPTIPQRLNYLLWVEDLLGLFPKRGFPISGIDIGTGPCAIFSLLGAKKNGWYFVATETSDEAIHWAEKNIKANKLESHINVIEVDNDSILEEVLSDNDSIYDFCLCNPPFFESIEEIKRRSSRSVETLVTTAKREEILAEGGEVMFVKNMIKDSLAFKDRVCLYTSMFGRKKSFLQILKELQSIKDISYTKTEFCQGNTIRWGIAWSFLKSVNLQKLAQPKPKKPKKEKPPLLHKIPTTDKIPTVRKLAKWMKNSFLELEILFKVIKNAENYAEIQITTDKNTWSHQRRKRRELFKDKDVPSTKDDLKATTPLVNKTLIINKDSDLSHSVISNLSSFDIENTKQSLHLKKDLSASSHSETFLGNTEIKESTSDCVHNERKDGSTDTVSLQNTSTSSPPLTGSKKRKIEDEENVKCSSSQKLKTENHENTASMESSSICPQSETESKNVKMEIEEPSEIAVSQKLKVKNTDDCGDLVSQEVKVNCPEGDTMQEESGMMVSEGTSSTPIKSDLQISSKGGNVGIDLKDKQNTNVMFEPKSLLFSTLKIRKGEDHLLLEMNCLPEANRESMHQIFQFLKNKLAIS